MINAGGLKSLQPDIRVHPKRVYRDRSLGNDADVEPENDGGSSFRSIVEVEWMYRGPVGLREREVTSASTRNQKKTQIGSQVMTMMQMIMIVDSNMFECFLDVHYYLEVIQL